MQNKGSSKGRLDFLSGVRGRMFNPHTPTIRTHVNSG